MPHRARSAAWLPGDRAHDFCRKPAEVLPSSVSPEQNCAAAVGDLLDDTGQQAFRRCRGTDPITEAG
jgi:hypothetical protein